MSFPRTRQEAMDEQRDQARAEYDALPEAIRHYYSWVQYQWLSESEKARLIQSETEPDQYDD
jgi:hypothetical protein